MPKTNEQDAHAVAFERPLPANLMAIDGTWRRFCIVKEVSDRGAILELESSVQGLSLNEFFLVLSSRGLAYRRCELEKMNGAEMEVRFLRQKDRKKRAEQNQQPA